MDVHNLTGCTCWPGAHGPGQPQPPPSGRPGAPPPMVGQQGPRSYLSWRLIRQQGTKHLDAPAFHLPYPCVVTKKGESGNLSLVVGLGKVR